MILLKKRWIFIVFHFAIFNDTNAVAILTVQKTFKKNKNYYYNFSANAVPFSIFRKDLKKQKRNYNI